MNVQMRRIDSIQPYPNNPRHNDAGVDAVAASLREYGFRQPLVVDENDVILVGHTRYKAALKLGLEEVPVHVASGLSPAQAKAYRLADNQTATLSFWDDDKLSLELAQLQQLDFDLDLTGFSADELVQWLGSEENQGLTDPGAVPEPPDEPITQQGDLWGGYANCGNYPPVLKATGLYFSQAIIWDKQHPVLTRKDYLGTHEWCFYGWKEGAAHSFFGPNNATDLWSIKKVNPQNMIHLTEKPVALATRALEYSSRVGENVLDLFGGSGSTLIAAHQSGRQAFLMEVDPLYCDVIVQRWQDFTGQSGQRLGRRKKR